MLQKEAISIIRKINNPGIDDSSKREAIDIVMNSESMIGQLKHKDFLALLVYMYRLLQEKQIKKH